MTGLAATILVAVGGATGAVCRYGIQQYTPEATGKPFATVAVNLLGCLAIGILYAITNNFNAPVWLNRLLVAGFLGGFTTFSAFALDVATMLQAGRYLQAAGYLGISVIGGMLLCGAGMWLTEKSISSLT